MYGIGEGASTLGDELAKESSRNEEGSADAKEIEAAKATTTNTFFISKSFIYSYYGN